MDVMVYLLYVGVPLAVVLKIYFIFRNEKDEKWHEMVYATKVKRGSGQFIIGADRGRDGFEVTTVTMAWPDVEQWAAERSLNSNGREVYITQRFYEGHTTSVWRRGRQVRTIEKYDYEDRA